MKTKVKMKCLSIKESENWQGGIDFAKKHPKQYEIELDVPYDPQDDYFKLSGDTNFTLKTVNQEVAKMFDIGGYYDVYIEPSEKEITKE